MKKRSLNLITDYIYDSDEPMQFTEVMSEDELNERFDELYNDFFGLVKKKNIEESCSFII